MMLYFVVYAIIFAVNWPTKNAARVQQLCNENLTSLWRYVFIYLFATVANRNTFMGYSTDSI